MAENHPISISLIGAGGTGSQVLQGLARIHVALRAIGRPGLHVTVFDGDVVTEANVGRQLFSRVDEGQYKANVLVSRVNRFYGLAWTSWPVNFDMKVYKDDFINACSNLVISCVDSAAARIEIHSVYQRLKKDHAGETAEPYHKPLYWMDFGNNQTSGQCILGTFDRILQPLSKHETKDYLFNVVDYFSAETLLEQDTHAKQGPSCSLAEALIHQDLFINTVLANLGCSLLWRMLKNGFTNFQGFYLNLQTMCSNPISF